MPQDAPRRRVWRFVGRGDPQGHRRTKRRGGPTWRVYVERHEHVTKRGQSPGFVAIGPGNRAGSSRRYDRVSGAGGGASHDRRVSRDRGTVPWGGSKRPDGRAGHHTRERRRHGARGDPGTGNWRFLHETPRRSHLTARGPAMSHVTWWRNPRVAHAWRPGAARALCGAAALRVGPAVRSSWRGRRCRTCALLAKAKVTMWWSGGARSKE